MNNKEHINALFVFSSRTYINNGKHYTLNLTPDVLHKLYFPYCNQLTVCTRGKEVDSIVGLTLAEADDIKYECPTDVSSSLDLYIFKKGKMKRIIKKNVKKADFVIARMGICGVYAAKYARKYNVPYVCEVVGNSYSTFSSRGLKGKLFAPYIEKMVKKELKKAKYAIYVTQKSLQQQYPTMGKFVGISDVEINCVDQANLIERLNKINSYSTSMELKLLTVGAVDNEVKGQEYVIRAIARLKRKGLSFQYHLIGMGNKNCLENLAIELDVINEVKFIGTLPHETLLDYYKEMDLYIQPSIAEGLPRAIVEAMSVSLPCAGSNVDGIPELLEETMIFESGNIDQIEMLLENLTTERLLENAKYSYDKSKEYLTDVLNEKRKQFWEMFIKENF